MPIVGIERKKEGKKERKKKERKKESIGIAVQGDGSFCGWC